MWKNMSLRPTDEDIYKAMKSSISNDNQVPTENINTSMKPDDIFSPLYKEFITIDWMRGVTEIHERILKQRRFHKFGNIFQKFKALSDASSGWIIVLGLGILTGVISVALDSSSQLLTDIRQGVCVRSFLLDKSQCCWPNQANIKTTFYSKCDVWQRWSTLLKADSSEPLAYVVNYIIYILFSLVYILVAALFVKFVSPFACGTTIPQVKTLLGGFIVPGYFSIQNGIVNALGIVLTISSGLNVGMEGAMILVSSVIGNHISSLFSKYRVGKSKRQEVISAATATGIAISFAAPVGGVLFSLEEASYYFPFKTLWRTFFSSMVASFVRINISYKYDGKGVLYYFHSLTNWKSFELIPILFISVIGALFGCLFIELTSYLGRKRRSTFIANYPSIEIAAVILLTCLISYPIKLTRISNHQLLSELINDFDSPLKTNETVVSLDPNDLTDLWHLSLTILIKTILFVFTVGLKLPTGIFLPCLAIGASFGKIVGILMSFIVKKYSDWPLFLQYCGQSNHQCISTGFYCIIGAASFLGGVTRMTVSLVVIIVELTGNLNYLLPIMISIMITRILASLITPLGFFDRSIKDRHYPYLSNKDENYPSENVRSLISWKVQELPTYTLLTLRSFGMTVMDIDNLLSRCSFYGVPIVDVEDSTKLMGFATTKELLYNLRSSVRLNRNLSSNSLVLLCKHGNDNFQSQNLFGISEHQELSYNFVCEDKNYVNLCASVDVAPICVNLDMPLEMLIGMFSKLGLRYVIVVHEGKLIDIVTKKDLLAYLDLNSFATIGS